jgi:NAD(P)-dependent dehydrogenase (short-subunit alcohol dehydrogenase family)
VNNAGATWGAPAEDYPDDAWMKVINLNVNSMFFLTQRSRQTRLHPAALGQDHRHRLDFRAARQPADMPTIAYNASKGADVNFVRALAAEWGSYNINVNAICPGFFPSKMANGLLEKFGEQIVAHTPLGRLGGEEDLKGAVVYLASEASRHVTGHALVVDGGSTSY